MFPVGLDPGKRDKGACLPCLPRGRGRPTGGVNQNETTPNAPATARGAGVVVEFLFCWAKEATGCRSTNTSAGAAASGSS